MVKEVDESSRYAAGEQSAESAICADFLPAGRKPRGHTGAMRHLSDTLRCCLALGALAGCAEHSDGDGAKRPESVLLITLDTTRADRLGCYGYRSAHTPCIDALAERGVRFHSAYATAPITLAAHVSLLTGTYPCAHGIRDNGIFELGDQAETLAEVFQAQDYATAAFVSAYVVDRSFGLGQGFATYPRPASGGKDGQPIATELIAEQVVERFLGWLDELPATSPFFVWLHFFDPHQPLAPPNSYRTRFEDLYDAEIAYCDDQLQRVFTALESQQRRDDLLVILTADHGESLGEKGEKTHGLTVSEGALRVPLIVAPPPIWGWPDLPRTVAGPVTAAGIPRTILTLLRLPDLLPEALPSLLTLQGETAVDPEQPIYFEAFTPFFTYRWAPQQGLLSRSRKFVRTRKSEIFDRAADPDETANLFDENPPLRAELETLLARLLEEHPVLGWETQQSVDAEERRRLEALGYTIGATGTPSFDEPDVKDRIQTLDWMDHARGYIESARLARSMKQEARAQKLFAQAERLLEQIESVALEGPAPAELRGRLYFHQSRRKRAIPFFEKALLALPRSAALHHFLGQCYKSTGHRDWAEAEFRKVIYLEPHFIEAYKELGQILMAQERLGEMVFWLQQLLRVYRQEDMVDPKMVQELANLERRMQEAGQSVQPPDDLDQAFDLTPEGARER